MEEIFSVLLFSVDIKLHLFKATFFYFYYNNMKCLKMFFMHFMFKKYFEKINTICWWNCCWNVE